MRAKEEGIGRMVQCSCGLSAAVPETRWLVGLERGVNVQECFPGPRLVRLARWVDHEGMREVRVEY